MLNDTIVTIIFAVFAGIAATITMDVLEIVSHKIGVTVGVKGQWVGRWYLGIARGKLVHENIEDVPEQPGELQAAMIGHYTIGTVLAVIYVIGAEWLSISPGHFLVAIIFGLATCVFPWFLVFPALGFGVFGTKGPRELKMFRTSVINHLFYGFGLWWSFLVLPF